MLICVYDCRHLLNLTDYLLYDELLSTDWLFGILQLYIEGYLQAMLDSMYRQAYLRVSVIDDQVIIQGKVKDI